MNSITLWGRLVKDPLIRWVDIKDGQEKMCVARYTLAVNRQDSYKAKGENVQTADFIPCVVFGKGAEMAEKYFKKGMAIVINGKLETGSYTNKEGKKIFTMEVRVDRQEFTERKAVREQTAEADNNKKDAEVNQSLDSSEEYYMSIGPEIAAEDEIAPEDNYMEFGAEL